MPGTILPPGALMSQLKSVPARKRGAAAAAASAAAEPSAGSASTGAGKRGADVAAAAATAPVTSSQLSAMTDLKDSVLQKAGLACAGEAGVEREGSGGGVVGAGRTAEERREAQSRQELSGGGAAAAAPAVVPVRRRGGAAGVRVSNVRRRSEIDRRLEALVGPSGRLRDVSRVNIIKVRACVVRRNFSLMHTCVPVLDSRLQAGCTHTRLCCAMDCCCGLIRDRIWTIS